MITVEATSILKLTGIGCSFPSLSMERREIEHIRQRCTRLYRVQLSEFVDGAKGNRTYSAKVNPAVSGAALRVCRWSEAKSNAPRTPGEDKNKDPMKVNERALDAA